FGGLGVPVPGSGGSGFIPGSRGIAVGVNGTDGGVVGTDGSDAVAKGTDGADADSGGERFLPQTQRYLKVKNDTGGKLKVFVQYRAKTDKGAWVWLPASPEDSAKALVFELADGEAVYLKAGEQRIAGS